MSITTKNFFRFVDLIAAMLPHTTIGHSGEIGGDDFVWLVGLAKMSQRDRVSELCQAGRDQRLAVIEVIANQIQQLTETK